MPKSIKTEHINRMFPFEFYEELSEQLTGYRLLNPAFLLKDIIKETTEERKKMFHSSRDNQTTNTLNANNILEVEPFGELLVLEACCPEEMVKKMLTQKGKNATTTKDERSQMPLTFLVAQLYDSTDEPVFSSGVAEESIAKIPEVLWDDPNLLLAVISITQEGPTVGVIKIPERIEGKILETKDPDES